MPFEVQRRITLGLIIFFLIVVLATFYYWQFQSYPIADALYFTIITITTVGFSEVHELDQAGRLVTIVVILIGVGAGFYTLAGLFEHVVGRQIGRIGRRRLERQVGHMKNHAIVCGYGRIGAQVAHLLRERMDVIVIDQDPARVEQCRQANLLTVQGDAADDDVLNEVGLDHARVLIAALPTDADNFYVVLSGRALNPNLNIVSRAQHASSGEKLIRAGANRV